MERLYGITEGLTQNIEESLYNILLPGVLKIILPYVIAILIFGVIRIIFACLLRGNRTLRILVDAVIVLVFLVVCGLILVPITTHTISTMGSEIEISVPEFSGSDPFSGNSVPEYSGSDPFSGISVPEFSGSDPFKISSDGSSS